MRELPLSKDQSIATQRHNLEGVVYCLSGTLPGRRAGVADATFCWSTLTFSGAYGDFEAYLSPPQQVLRAAGFLPGEGSETSAVRIPMFNRRFGEGDSLLGVIDDGVYAWEEAEATLRVGYLKPGQTAADLVSGDWTTLIQDGFLGAPENITLEGFVVPLFSRGAQRNRAFKQPRTPGTAELISGAIEKRDLGVPMPVIIGKPSTWFRPPTLDPGIRGFTTSAFSAGATQVEVALITDGQYEANDAGVPTLTPPVAVHGNTISGSAVFWIHRQNPLYVSISSGNVYNRASGLLTLQLASGLLADVPRGAFVQEHNRYRSSALGAGAFHKWVVAAHEVLGFNTSAGESQQDLEGNIGWLFADGTIRVADPDVWRFNTDLNAGAGDENVIPFDAQGYENVTYLRRAENGTLRDVDGTIDTNPPVFFDPDFGVATVTQQPTFTSTARQTSKLNYPTGGTGTDNANARDGSPETGAALSASDVITLTFNSIGGSTFADSDTTYSVLHVIVQGNIIFTDSLGSTTYGTAAGTGGVNKQFRFVQASPRDYNATVRCVGDTGGGTVVEVWWEHDLEATETSTRTADVELSSGPGGAVSGITLGAPMEFSQLVMRLPSTNGGVAGLGYSDRSAGFFTPSNAPFWEQDFEDTVSNGPTMSGDRPPPGKAYPTGAMQALQSIFLGRKFGSFLDVNSGVYRTAHERYKTLDYRWGFVLEREVNSWTELEADLAKQARAHMYYGPQGHEIVVIEDAQTFQQSGAVQEFRLPGAPGANAGRPRLSRTRPDEIINSVRILYDEDLVEGGGLRRSEEANNAASQAIYGVRRDARGGDLRFWAWSEWDAHPSFDARAAVSGIGQLYADRGAFATTRFEFDTAWVAHGVERGSPVRMVYAVASGVYRNVIAEVERISVSPSDGERFSIQARAVTTPTEGLPAFTWEDVFLTQGDSWTSKITTESTVWTDKWSI